MDLTIKIIVLVLVGLVILVTLLGEFRPRARARRRDHLGEPTRPSDATRVRVGAGSPR